MKENNELRMEMNIALPYVFRKDEANLWTSEISLAFAISLIQPAGPIWNYLKDFVSVLICNSGLFKEKKIDLFAGSHMRGKMVEDVLGIKE